MLIHTNPLNLLAAGSMVARRTVAALALATWAACVLSMVPLSADAQNLKIGYVNSERVTLESLPGRAIGEKLQAEFGERERRLTEQEARLRAAAEKLDKDSPTLSEPERARRQRELIDQDRELQRKRREFNEDFVQRRAEEMSAVEELARRAIRKIFEEEKYDLILQEAVRAGPNVDITEKVIKAMGAAAPATR